jgi:DNA processing protein
MSSGTPDLKDDLQGLAAWLRLTLIPGIGRESQRKLLNAFGLPEQIFSASWSALESVIGSAKAQSLLETDNKAAVEAALSWAQEPGHHILTLADTAYPPQLLQIPDPPVLFYARGNPAVLSRPAIAVVGSRNATPQGLKAAQDFSATLAASGFCIVSGLALGIDAAAHQGALAAHQGMTTAVVGTGADRLYPARNQDLARQIIERGAIFSEFPLGTPAAAENFPRRNRIISGLARGVLVVEAALQSGSLITARLAGEQGREVFAIPGSIHSPLSRGCHWLIRQGAKLVESAQDILEELGECAAAPAAPLLPQQDNAPMPGGVEGQVLEQLGHGPCTLDDLAQRSGLAAEALLAVLMGLELEGRLASLPGNRYQRL